MSPIKSQHPGPRPAPRPGRAEAPGGAGRVWRWVYRYAPQDLAAAAALILVAQLLGHLGPVRLAASATAAELTAFFGVAFWRQWRVTRSAPRVLAGLLAEYGPAELVDLAVRPAALGLCAATMTASPTVALLVGSCLADAFYYGIAARSHAAKARYQPRASGRGETRTSTSRAGF